MTKPMPTARLTLPVAALLLAALGACAPAFAQQIYRIVGPDGRVTFSDKPPTQAASGATPAKTVPLASGGGASDTAALPFELRQAASRYPVTIYTAPECPTCVAGRNFLVRRGIPFAERTITSNEDIEALKRMSGAGTVPFLTIGGQQLKGYSSSEWDQFLDAAGYPRTSQLPAGYTRAPATPLVVVQSPSQPKPAGSEEQASGLPPLPAAPLPEGDNPSGIRF